MRVELLHTEGCPGTEPSRELLAAVLGELVPGTEVIDVPISSEERARELGFRGSPSIRIDGRDLEERPPESTGLT